MPAVQAGTVLVTGASGFTCAWITKALLDAGFAVRGTVRSAEKGDYLKTLYKSDLFSYVIVDDISKSGAFDDALDEEITAVIHGAGAVHLAESYEKSALLGPNVDSVKYLCDSIIRLGPQVKRFVYLSSAQALLGNDDLFHVYTEKDWNDKAVSAIQEGSEVPAQVLYPASKVLAERWLEEFSRTAQPKFDITRILPVFIYGPIIHECSSLEKLNLTSKLMRQYLKHSVAAEQYSGYLSEFIDVRDVADAFVASLKVEEAGGERFILDAGAFTYQNLYDAFHSIEKNNKEVPIGDPDAPKFEFPGPFCSSEKAITTLKLRAFKGLAEVAYDSYNSYKERGF